MDTEPDCIFCGIVAGKLPSTTIAQTERAIAFMDINPVTPGHAVVIPRSHAIDMIDITAEDLAACADLAQRIAGRAKDRLGADGINLLNCSGEAAWQTVFLPQSRHSAIQGPAGQGPHRAAVEHRFQQPRGD